MQNRLAIVTAPPGSGKTVLLADWCREYGDGHVAWLTLDEGDDDPETFWRRLTMALNVGGAGHASWVDETISQAHARPRIGSWLGAGDLSPLVLVLDDFHRITNAEIANSVADLVRDLPPYVRVLLAGQHVTGSALKRLLLRGEVTALGDTELRFSVEETAALIALVSGKYPHLEAVKTLTDRCEGWAAGLHLAATALADEDDPSSYAARFSGSSSPVADYLAQELLVGQPPGLVRFFLQTSVLEELTADGCHAVTGRSDAGMILERLADRGLFVIPVGSAGRYRYHGLFVDLLRHRLEQEWGTLARQAHRNAAAWFENVGDLRSAARQYALAGAYEQSFRLAFPSNALASSARNSRCDPAHQIGRGRRRGKL